jgi:hypothetical protein
MGQMARRKALKIRQPALVAFVHTATVAAPTGGGGKGGGLPTPGQVPARPRHIVAVTALTACISKESQQAHYYFGAGSRGQKGLLALNALRKEGEGFDLEEAISGDAASNGKTSSTANM